MRRLEGTNCRIQCFVVGDLFALVNTYMTTPVMRPFETPGSAATARLMHCDSVDEISVSTT